MTCYLFRCLWQVEGVDYRLVSERVWRALTLEFGYDWEICRSVVSRSGVLGGPTELTIDMYPANLQVEYAD
jgi:hypothetical protein